MPVQQTHRLKELNFHQGQVQSLCFSLPFPISLSWENRVEEFWCFQAVQVKGPHCGSTCPVKFCSLCLSPHSLCSTGTSVTSDPPTWLHPFRNSRYPSPTHLARPLSHPISSMTQPDVFGFGPIPTLLGEHPLLGTQCSCQPVWPVTLLSGLKPENWETHFRPFPFSLSSPQWTDCFISILPDQNCLYDICLLPFTMPCGLLLASSLTWSWFCPP